MKDGSSLVVTPSSIPSFATRGPDADLSFEGSEEVLKDSNDDPTIKKRISNSDEEEGDEHEVKAMGVYLSYLLSFLFTLYLCHLLHFSFYMYLRDFLMQSPFILHVHSSYYKES